MAEQEKKLKAEKPKESEMVGLKEVAKQAGITAREARVLLRKAIPRKDDQKRARWQWAPGAVAGIVATLKKAVADKAKAKEEKEKEEAG